MKLVKNILVTFGFLLGGGQSAVRVELCKMLLKRESEVFVKDTQFAVDAHFENRPAEQSEKNKWISGLEALNSMITAELNREVSACAQINALAYAFGKMERLGAFSSQVFSRGSDHFFVTLGVEILEQAPDVNLMEYEGIVHDPLMRQNLNFLFHLARTVGVSSVWLDKISLNYVREPESLTWRIDRMRAIMSSELDNEASMMEIRVMMGITSAHAGIWRLFEANMVRFKSLGDSFSGDFHHDLVGCMSDRCGNLENGRIVSAIKSVAELMEMLVYYTMPATGEGTQPVGDLVNRAADSLMKALRSEDDSSIQLAHLAKVSDLVEKALPFLQTASRHASAILGGFEQSMHQRANALAEIARARLSILPQLFNFLRLTTPRLIQNQLLAQEGQALQHEAFVHAVSITSMNILERSGPSSSWLPLAKILSICNSGYVSANDFILSEDSEKMTETVLKMAFAFRANYGVDILQQFPNLLPTYSASKLQSSRRIVYIFMDFGLTECESLWWPPHQSYSNPAGLASYLDAASDERVADAVRFLNSYNQKVQFRRRKNNYNEVPLLSPALFLREYLGQWTSVEFTTEPSPHSLALIKGLQFLDVHSLDLRRDDALTMYLPGHISRFGIAPFLGQFSEYLELCQEMSEIYREGGSFLEYFYPGLIESARQLPAALFHAASQTASGAEQREILLQVGRAVVEVMKRSLESKTAIPVLSRVALIVQLILKKVRIIATRETSNSVDARNSAEFQSLAIHTQRLRLMRALARPPPTN